MLGRDTPSAFEPTGYTHTSIDGFERKSLPSRRQVPAIIANMRYQCLLDSELDCLSFMVANS